MYFLNNGEGLDPENLPAQLRVAEVNEAMSVLREVTQDEIERARYEDREKARRDALSWEKALERRHAKALAEAQTQALSEGLAKGLAKGRTEGRTEGRAEGLLRLYERRLGRDLTEPEHATLRARLETLGADRFIDAVLGLEGTQLARWLADPEAK